MIGGRISEEVGSLVVLGRDINAVGCKIKMKGPGFFGIGPFYLISRDKKGLRIVCKWFWVSEMEKMKNYIPVPQAGHFQRSGTTVINGDSYKRIPWENAEYHRIRWLVMVSIMNEVSGCGPGRGQAGRRRGVHKLTPLVFKQHVPNVSENTLSASGLTEGRITRDDPRFRDLIPNYNSDIIFKDEEGTGADRFMTQRCKEKLNTLAISVMNQWPGVKLRVTEGWDEEGHHATDSLHYEGRAVDVTTSDRDRSKYGMLAKLAVEAGFDWVYYESRAHIHCSVKSESSQAVKSGGCFPGDAKVKMRSGESMLSSLQVGDEVQVMDPQTGQIKYSEVMLFLDRNPGQFRNYIQIETLSGKKLQVTPSHLIIAIKPTNSEFNDGTMLVNDIKLFNSDRTKTVVESEVTSDMREKVFDSSSQKTIKSEILFASQIEVGDSLITTDGDRRLLDRVINVTNSRHQGVYAPLTTEGTIVVNDVVASCYAVVNSHSLAHFVYAPLRLYHNLELSIDRLWQSALKPFLILKSFKSADRYEKVGIHWYASLLYDVAEYILPSSMLYES